MPKLRAQRGLVSIVGAGPAGPELLTLKGYRRLGEADIILYDALVGEGFKELFGARARSLFVGKRCGAHTLAQAEICALLVRFGRQGKRVVRLKGGDPCVFGRGGEEAMALAAAGVAYELVPGVSALSAVAEAVSIPLTYRGVSRQVLALEGHSLAAQPPDWTALAAFDGTLVVFMGAGAAGEIAAQLTRHGARPALPMALVESAPDGAAVVTETTLGAAATGGLARRTSGPGIIYIGEVVALRGQLGRTHITAPAAGVAPGAAAPLAPVWRTRDDGALAHFS